MVRASVWARAWALTAAGRAACAAAPAPDDSELLLHLWEPLRAGGGAGGELAASPLQACALESAARAAPGARVVVWTNRVLVRRAAAGPDALRLLNVERRSYDPAALGLSAALGDLEAIEAAALARIVSEHGGFSLANDIVSLGKPRAGEARVECDAGSAPADALALAEGPQSEALAACVARGHSLKTRERALLQRVPDWTAWAATQRASLLAQVMQSRCPQTWTRLAAGRFAKEEPVMPDSAIGAFLAEAWPAGRVLGGFAPVELDALPHRSVPCIVSMGSGRWRRVRYDPLHLGAPVQEHALSECRAMLGVASDAVPRCVSDLVGCHSFAVVELSEPLRRGDGAAVVASLLDQRFFEFELSADVAAEEDAAGRVASGFVERFSLGSQSSTAQRDLARLLRRLLPVEGQGELERATDTRAPLTLVAPGEVPRIVWLYVEATPEQGRSVSAGAAARSLAEHAPADKGWHILALSPSTMWRFLSPEDLPESFSRLDAPTHRADVIRLALLYKYGGVWCDASLLLHTSLERLVMAPVLRGASFVAFSSQDHVHTAFLASAKQGAVVAAWRRTIYHELDAAAARAARSGLSLDHELLLDFSSIVTGEVDRGTPGAGIYQAAEAFASSCLARAMQRDAALEAIFAGPGVVLHAGEDGLTWVGAAPPFPSAAELTKHEVGLGHAVPATYLPELARDWVDENWWWAKNARPRPALAQLVRRALSPGFRAEVTCPGVALELLQPGPLEPVLQAASKVEIRARLTASDLQPWWVCTSLQSSLFAESSGSCLQSGTGVYYAFLEGKLRGPMLLRMWAQRGADGAPCESARASVLRPIWLSAAAIPGRPEELPRAGFRCGSDAVPGLPGACAHVEPACASEFPERTAAGRRAGEDRSPGSSLAIIVLVNRGASSLAEAARSWHAGGLLARAQRRVIFLQEWQHASASELDSEEAEEERERAQGLPRGCAQHVLAADPRVSALPAEYDFEVIGARRQRGIGPALAAMVRLVRDAEHILFLEEDFALADGVTEAEVEEMLERARSALRDGVSDVVKLRHRTLPGHPFSSGFCWDGRGREILTRQTSWNSNHSVLDSVHWLHDPAVFFSTDDLGNAVPAPVWHCGRGGQLFCAFSTHQGWTNNPVMFEPRFFMENIDAAAHASFYLEDELNLNPHLWTNRCFVVAQGQGLFTHRDLDKPFRKRATFLGDFWPDALKRLQAVRDAIAEQIRRERFATDE